MSPLLADLLLLAIGFVLLAKGADGLVEGGAALAQRWGVSPLMVGLTVVAWGTSMPEVVVSSIESWNGRGATSLGNALGSNVANIGLVLGTSTLILPVLLAGRAAAREIGWLLGSLALLWFLCRDMALSGPEAGVLIACFLGYNLHLWISFRGAQSSELEAEAQEVRMPGLRVVLGSVAIAAAAKLVTMGAEGIAERAGMTQVAIGLTVYALGTSLPELAAGIGSALKGHAEMSFGNVMGSNVFNTLAVTGIAGLVRPFGGGTEMQSALTRDFPVTIAFSLGLILLPILFKGRLRRGKAALLVGSYLAYMVWVLWTETSLGGA